ncbi:eCIS core domain-containing protein [Methylomonas sp. MgM2]
MMKTNTKKSSTAAKTPTQAANQAFFGKTGGGSFFAPAVQTKMTVNQPGDKFEQEADKTADKVMRMPAPVTGKDEKLQRAPEDKLQKKDEEKIRKADMPEEKVQKQEEEKIQKADMPEEKVQKQEDEKIRKAAEPEEKIRKQEEDKLQKADMPEEKLQKQADDKLQKADTPEEKIQKQTDEKLQKAAADENKLRRKGDAGAPSVSSDAQSSIKNKTAGGQPLSSDVRGFMEPRFNADFSNVRVHHDAESADLSHQLSARAFTYQNHVFFSKDQYRPGTSEGKQLLAHELTHTIQQGHAVQRSPQVTTTATPPAVQRLLGIDIPSWQDVIDWLAEKAYNIPGYRMFTIVIGVNPINGRDTDRSAANILRAVVEFLPGGKIITDALEKYGVFGKAGAWVEGKLKQFGNLLGSVKSAISEFLDDLDFIDIILHPVRTWERAVDIFTSPVKQIIDFIGGIFQDILQFIRDAVLMPLAALAQGKPGFDLLCAILGKNPISGEPVPRNADTLIGGFMKLIGQEEVWENIKKGHAVQKAWQWFQTAMQELFAMVVQFPQDFIAMLKSLEVLDFIVLPKLFVKVFKVFGGFVVKFSSWAFGTILSLLEIIFSVVAPGVMPYIAKAKGSFQKIIKNPVGFVGNLVKAGKMGFNLFMHNIGMHLKTALIKWIVGPLAEAGVYIPKAFSLTEILKLILSVLGLTWQNIRAKLVKVIPDPILAGLEKTAGILVTLVKEGPVAAWEQIKAELTELKDQLIAQVTQMVTTEIVKAAITKLVMMLNPAGAFVQAVLAIWNTISFFVQKIRQIGAVVGAFINSIAAIAAGQIAGAAKKVETTMANTLTVVIAFLAKFAGLGSIPEKIVGIINKIRAPIDKGLDKIVGWLGAMLKKLGGAVAQAGLPADPNERLKLAAAAAVTAARKLSGRVTQPLLTSALTVIKTRYGLQQILPYEKDGEWRVKLTINPVIDQATGVSSQSPAAGTAVGRVAVGSWIKLANGSFERVKDSATIVKRGADGKTQPVMFGTVKTDGSPGSHAYSAEGKDWERSAFTHASNFVTLEGSGTTFVLKPEYRGSKKIRPNFYSDSSSSLGAARSGKLPSLLHPSDPTKFLSEGSPAQEAAQGYTQTFNGKAVVPVAAASPDHDPPVADHWTNRQGNNTTQTSRENWNTDLNTYKLMSKKLNLSLGSRGENFTKTVGVDFRGPGE